VVEVIAVPETWTWDPPEIMGPRNRRVLAERAGDPAGSVEVCERVEAMFPARPDVRFHGLRVSWMKENTTRGFVGQAGFYATAVGTGYVWGWREKAAYGVTEAELVESCAALVDRLKRKASR
jgi:hypothetical protein